MLVSDGLCGSGQVCGDLGRYGPACAGMGAMVFAAIVFAAIAFASMVFAGIVFDAIAFASIVLAAIVFSLVFATQNIAGYMFVTSM